MKVTKMDGYDALSREAASMIISELKKYKSALLCAATGGSPTGTYEQLKQSFILQQKLFSNLRVIKLDEWGGLSMDNPATCECYLQKHLIGPLQISDDRYISFKSDPENPETECKRIHDELSKQGPIDICILGLGMNGHLALNEPGFTLEPQVHVAKLSASSQTHPMISGEGIKPSYGLTLGMGDILQSSFILMLISGAKKKEITSSFLNGKISTSLPASFLKLHSNTVCLVDKDAFP
jgi:galactosamine-6-phosphate isomerase